MRTFLVLLPRVARSLLPLAFALIAPGCGSPGGSSGDGRRAAHDPYVGEQNAAGKTVVLVIDKSLSMNQNDGRRYNEQGAQLAGAICSSADNVGAVTFSDDAQVIYKLRQLRNKDLRLELQRQLTDIRREGATNYVASLRAAAEMLARAGAPAGSSVVFLTDGEHTVGPKEKVLPETVQFAQKGWKIYVVALGKEAGGSKLARDIAVRTEAAFYHVVQAEDLMQAFLKILSQIFTFVEFDGGLRPIHIFPGTRRLIYLMIKQARETTISRLLHGGQNVDWRVTPNVYKYPVTPDPRGEFEAITAEEPQAGWWDAMITGPAKVGLILQQPPFSLSFEDGAPGGEYYNDEEVLVTLRADGNEDALRMLAKSGAAKATVTTQEGAAIAEFALDPQGGARWSGRFKAKADQEQVQQIVVRFTYTEQGGGTWSHEKRATVLVKTGQREAQIGLSAASVDFGAVWADGGEATAELELSSLGQAARMTVRSEGGRVQVDPAEFELPAGGKRKVTLKVSAAGEPGDREDSIVVTGVQTADAARVRVPPVKATWKVVKLEGKDSLDLGKLKPGQEYKVPIDLSVAGGELEAEARGLEGASVVEEGGKLFLTGRVPPTLEEKKHEGELWVKPKGANMPAKKVPFSVEVSGGIPEVKLKSPKIEIETGDEDAWSEASVEFAYDFVRDGTVTFKRQDLTGAGGKVSATLHQKVEPKGGWDGKTLKPGQSYAFTYKAYLSNDAKRGTYQGKLVLQVDDGKKTYDQEIPVTVTFKE